MSNLMNAVNAMPPKRAETPESRLAELKITEEGMTDHMNNLEVELRIVENERAIVRARINEIEWLHDYMSAARPR